MGEVINLHDERLKRQKREAWRKMKQRLLDDHDRFLWWSGLGDGLLNSYPFNCRCVVDLNKALTDLDKTLDSAWKEDK